MARVLVIEDEPDLQQVLDYNLRQAGHEVLAAFGGQDGLRIARERHPEIIVLDLMLPDLPGTEVCKTLKPSDRGELEITDVNNYYLERGDLTHDVLEGWWTDAGTFESLFRASEYVARGGANHSTDSARKDEPAGAAG